MKYILLVLTFITGGVPIYKSIKESYAKSKIARSPIKIKEHKVAMYEVIILLIVLLGTTTATGIIQHKDDLKAEVDSLRLEKHFSSIISGLKADTAELHKTNFKLEQTKDTLRQSLERNSLIIAQGINSSGKKLIQKIITTTENLNDRITGGNAYCIGSIISRGDGKFSLQLKNSFKNAIPNLAVNIINYSQLEVCPFIIDDTKKVYQKNCKDNNTISLIVGNCTPEVPYEIIGSDKFFITNGKIGKILIEFFSPGYYGYRCLQEILYEIHGKRTGLVKCRIIKIVNKKITELAHYNSGDIKFDKISWSEAFKSDFEEHSANF